MEPWEIAIADCEGQPVQGVTDFNTSWETAIGYEKSPEAFTAALRGSFYTKFFEKIKDEDEWKDHWKVRVMAAARLIGYLSAFSAYVEDQEEDAEIKGKHVGLLRRICGSLPSNLRGSDALVF